MPRCVAIGAAAGVIAFAGAAALATALEASSPARIAYLGKNALYTANSDGSGRAPVVRGVADNGTFSWSPDGTQFAFSGGHQRAAEVFVVNEDGGGLRQLTNPTGGGKSSDTNKAENPNWSPDGTQIVFDAARAETGGVQQIFVMDADGSAERQLTRGPGYKWVPVWSPDGRDVLYERFVGDPQSGRIDLMSVAPGGGERKVARVRSEAGHCVCAVWSPTGTQIAYEAAEGGGKPDIYVMNADGSGRTRLTRNPARDENPDWSPDGTQIAFYSERPGQAEIYIMNADGSKQRRVTHDPWYDSAVRWKPTP